MSTYAAMTLGDLIDALEACPLGMPVLLDDGRGIDDLISWRGVYADLALEPVVGDAAGLATVSELLKAALAADGGTFEEPVTRCAVCLAPRCGNTLTPDPCMERRHHDGLHIYRSGRFRPLGGVLPSDATS